MPYNLEILPIIIPRQPSIFIGTKDIGFQSRELFTLTSFKPLSPFYTICYMAKDLLIITLF